MLLYLYDIKVGSIRDYNRVKRRFYYALKKSRLSVLPFKTKSAILVPDELELTADVFFSNFSEYLVVYKAYVTHIHSLGIKEAKNEEG